MIALVMTGVLALFAYIVPLLTTVTGIATATVPWLLFVSGIGGIGGNLIGGRLGDWRPMPVLFRVFTLLIAIYLAALIAVADPSLWRSSSSSPR